MPTGPFQTVQQTIQQRSSASTLEQGSAPACTIAGNRACRLGSEVHVGGHADGHLSPDGVVARRTARHQVPFVTVASWASCGTSVSQGIALQAGQ